MKFKEYKGLDLAGLATEVLNEWDAHDTFHKSISTREGHPTFVFYEGPPSANGMPGIHHVMARTIKDVFCRYKTQQGYLVHRKAGWDTHGLPVELGVEKKLGITKEDIGRKISIEEYNRACREAVMEFVGEGVKSLTMEDRLCICNMAIEAGAKNGIFPVDEITEAYLKGRSQRPWVKYEADPDAEYERTVTIDLTMLEPTVSYPHLPENTHPASEGKDIKIDQVVIGSCTNGRLEDMEAAYNILKGKHIAKGVRGIIIPATMAVYKECILRGWTTAFIDAGCIVSTPTCGPCLGGYMGILAEGERCVSTTNRNFVGRMGHVKSEVYLASPATAAASALTGYITDPRTV